MKKLHFIYEMQIKYSEEVSRCNFTIKCIPGNTLRQKTENYTIDVFPFTNYCIGRDGLRNLQIYGVNEDPHSLFVFRIEGNVITGLSDFEELVDEDVEMIFRHPYGLNQAGGAIKSFFEKNKPEEYLSDYEKAVNLMHLLYENFKYVPFSTSVQTKAEEAFVQGKGVCQDYSHIFIALLHLAGINARYVTGLIVGEGASHAWVEVLCNGRWYGFDPTNNIIVSDEHIKIGVGRDAGDCMINRGIMHGGGLHTQNINVSVKEITS